VQERLGGDERRLVWHLVLEGPLPARAVRVLRLGGGVVGLAPGGELARRVCLQERICRGDRRVVLCQLRDGDEFERVP